MRKKITPKEQKIKKAIKDARKNILVEIGNCMYKYRDAMGYSQENVANDIDKINIIPETYAELYSDSPALETNFSAKVISRYETGAAEMGIIAFINICRGLKITPNELLKKYFPDMKFERSEFLDRYEQLDDEHKTKVIEYIDYMRFDQDRGRKSTLK